MSGWTTHLVDMQQKDVCPHWEQSREQQATGRAFKAQHRSYGMDLIQQAIRSSA